MAEDAPVAEKFGTFTGVFTPTLLTILGVIMYIPLPCAAAQRPLGRGRGRGDPSDETVSE